MDLKISVQDKTHRCGPEHTSGEDIGPRGEPITLILLNGHSIKILTISVPIVSADLSPSEE